MSYNIEITAVDYSYADVEEGDRRELASDSTTLIMDDDERDYFAEIGTAQVEWAVYVIDTTTDVVHPSSSPINGREHEWLSGTYTNPYNNDLQTETSVRLTGDWTDEERVAVFTAITSKYHTA